LVRLCIADNNLRVAESDPKNAAPDDDAMARMIARAEAAERDAAGG
jgi:hypothetical protein